MRAIDDTLTCVAPVTSFQVFWGIFWNSNLMTGHLRFPVSMLDESFYKLAMRHGLKYTDFIHPCAFTGYAPFMFAGRLVVVVMPPANYDLKLRREKQIVWWSFSRRIQTMFCYYLAFIINMNILVFTFYWTFYSIFFFYISDPGFTKSAWSPQPSQSSQGKITYSLFTYTI